MALISRRGAALSAAAVVLATLAFVPAASGQSPAAGSAAAPPSSEVPCQMPAGKSGGKFKVALANREITNDANRDIIAGATAEIEAAGGEIAQTTDAGTDPLKHNDNIATLINSDVDAILVQLGDAQQLSPLALQAKEKGILMATTLVGATAEGALTDVGFDDPLATALETRALFSSIGYKGDVYLFWVPGAPILETRRAIAETMAKDYAQITIHEVPTEHGAVKTLSQMTDILTANPDPGSIAGIWGAYDLLVSGAVEAVRRAGRGNEIKAVSIDGDEIAFQMLFTEGSPFVSTVVADMKGIGKGAADAIILASCGRANEVPLRGYTPLWVANRHNGIAAGEKRWGEKLWTDIQMDKNQIAQTFPQTQDVRVVQPQLP